MKEKVVIFMNKKSEKKNEKYPIELPSRDSTIKRSPIVDVTENEIYPMDFHNSHYNNGVVEYSSAEDISKVVSTEIGSDMAGQTTHGL